jgi:hypothetical protein
MPNAPTLRSPLAAGACFAAGTLLSAILALILFVLHVSNREPATLDTIADPILFALIGFLGGSILFRGMRVGASFAAGFVLYPFIARTLYQLGRAIPYDGAALDLLTSFYFALLMPALACGASGAVAMWLTPAYRAAAGQAFAIFAIAGAIGGAAAPLISWSLSQMAAESALAATLSIYGEELLRFFLAGAGLAWMLERNEVTAV